MEGCWASLEELKQREKFCDIVISEYIEKNYQERQLFYSKNHPANEVLQKITSRILEAIDIKTVFTDIQAVESKFTLKGQDVPLYPSVVKVLGLKQYDTVFYPNRYLWPFCGNLVEFTEAYLKWCWGIE